MAPIVKELAAEFGGKIAFGKLDVGTRRYGARENQDEKDDGDSL
jgi:hypothetical protein